MVKAGIDQWSNQVMKENRGLLVELRGMEERNMALLHMLQVGRAPTRKGREGGCR